MVMATEPAVAAAGLSEEQAELLVEVVDLVRQARTAALVAALNQMDVKTLRTFRSILTASRDRTAERGNK